MRAGIEPGIAPPHTLDRQRTEIKITPVEVGDLQLAASRGREFPGMLHGMVVVKIEAGYCEVGFWRSRLFFEADCPAADIEFHDAVPLGVVHVVGEDRRPIHMRIGCSENFGKGMSVENIVAQHQGCRRVPEKVCTDDEGLGEAVGRRLLGIPDMQPPLGSIAEQGFEQGHVVRGRDDENVPKSGQHQRSQRVVDQRFVEHGQELLGYGSGRRIQSGSRAARQNDAFPLHRAFECWPRRLMKISPAG